MRASLVLAFVAIGLASTTSSCGTENKKKKKNSVPASANSDDANPDDDSVEGKTGPTSLEAFTQTLYPILRDHCQTCHAKTITPFFASADAQIAHDALINTKKVNLDDIPSSRLLARLAADKHNCWSGNCEADAEDIKAALTEWKSAMAKPDKGDASGKVTKSLRLVDAVRRSIGPGPGTIDLEAEAATLGQPMRTQTDAAASGGTFVVAPNVNNNTLQPGAANAGSMQYNINVQVAGTYKIWARVMAPNNNDRSFYISVDGATPVAWVIPVANTWAWDAASTDNGAKDLTFNLTAGSHTIRITQRQDGTRIDRVVITDNMSFDGTNFGSQIDVLRFELASVLSGNTAVLEIEIAAFDSNTYKLSKPTVVTSNKNFKVKGMYVLLNEERDPQHATFSKLDMLVTAPGLQLSPAALIMLHDKGPGEDTFQIGFDDIQ